MKQIRLFLTAIGTALLMSSLAFAQESAVSVTESGNVGIGTSTPTSQLEVASTGTSTIISSAHNSTAQFLGQSAGGSPLSPTAVMSGTQLSWFGARGFTGSEYSPTRAAMIMNASEDWSGSSHGAEIAFGTTQNGTTSRVERMRITHDGWVGIGTSTPSSQLEVVSAGTSTITSSAYNATAQFIGKVALGSPLSPTAVTNGIRLAWFGARGFTGSGYSPSRAAMIMNASEDWSGSSHGAEIAFGTTENGTTSRVERMRIRHDGNVGIGAAYSNVGLNVRGGKLWILRTEKTDGTLVFGTFQAGAEVHGDFTVTNGTKNFQIDHPVDPANKKLRHNAVEGPDYITFYQGRVSLGSDGEATASLPDYFEALNTNVHYQLTCVGGYAQVYVADEVSNNQFRIAGGTPGLIVSWQITAVRNDPYAARHPYQAEIEKEDEERGRYFDPEGYGAPASMQIGRRADDGSN
jgi:hypothetical protein